MVFRAGALTQAGVGEAVALPGQQQETRHGNIIFDIRVRFSQCKFPF